MSALSGGQTNIMVALIPNDLTCSFVSNRRRSGLWSVQSWQRYTGLHHSAGSGSEKHIVCHRSLWSVWQMWRLLTKYFCNTPLTCCQVIMSQLIKESHTAAFLPPHAELMNQISSCRPCSSERRESIRCVRVRDKRLPSLLSRFTYWDGGLRLNFWFSLVY